MAAENEQVRPLAPASGRIHTDTEVAATSSTVDQLKKDRRRRRIKYCCGCTCVTLLILVIVLIVLIFTVFRVKDPVLRLNSITIDGWSNVMWSNLQPGMNLTIIADMSMKNRNAASFKFNSATTTVSYDSVVIGDAQTPAGKARARRTLRMNATIDAMLDRIVGVPRLGNDLRLGVLPLSAQARVSGKVHIIIKKTVRVRMTCTLSLNINTQQIQDLSCDNKFSL